MGGHLLGHSKNDEPCVLDDAVGKCAGLVHDRPGRAQHVETTRRPQPAFRLFSHQIGAALMKLQPLHENLRIELSQRRHRFADDATLVLSAPGPRLRAAPPHKPQMYCAGTNGALQQKRRCAGTSLMPPARIEHAHAV